jgi:hypothetical protein
MHLLVGDYSTSSTEAIENFRSWEEEHSLKVEVPRLFSGAGVFPGVRDGYYGCSVRQRLLESVRYKGVSLALKGSGKSCS